MKILKSTASQYLITLREYFKYAKKAKTTKQLSKELGIPQEFIEKFILTLKDTDYFNLETSNTGRLKRIKFNKYSTRIVYSNPRGAIEKGCITIGAPNKVFCELHGYEKRELELLPDKARAAGVYYVNYVLTNELFVEIFTKEMQLEVDDPENIVETSNDVFKDFPLVKAEIEKYTDLLAKLEKEVADEIALNERNAKWYKEEYYKASIGQRRKDESYSVVVGQERVVGVTYNKYWFDDEPTREYTESFVPKYETRYRSVVDYPKEPTVYTDVQLRNKDIIWRYKCYLESLTKNCIYNEKKLLEEKEKESQLNELITQKRELEKKIKLLS